MHARNCGALRKAKSHKPREAFAHCMSTAIGNPEALENIKKYFPQSYDVFRKALRKTIEEVENS